MDQNLAFIFHNLQISLDLYVLAIYLIPTLTVKVMPIIIILNSSLNYLDHLSFSLMNKQLTVGANLKSFFFHLPEVKSGVCPD